MCDIAKAPNLQPTLVTWISKEDEGKNSVSPCLHHLLKDEDIKLEGWLTRDRCQFSPEPPTGLSKDLTHTWTARMAS